MRLTVDLDAEELIASPTDRRKRGVVEFKRGLPKRLDIDFVRGGVAEDLAAGTEIIFGLKPVGKYDQAVLTVGTSDFIGPDANRLYTGFASFNTASLNTLLAKDGDDSNDISFVDLMGEITWKAPGDEGTGKTKTFVARVHNDVIRGEETTPAAMPDLTAWQRSALQLDSIPISGEPATASTASFTVTSGGFASLTILGIDFTFDSGGVSTPAEMAATLRGMINSEPLVNSQIIAGGGTPPEQVVLTALATGVDGNAYTLAVASGATISGPTFTGGSNGIEGTDAEPGQEAFVRIVETGQPTLYYRYSNFARAGEIEDWRRMQAFDGDGNLLADGFVPRKVTAAQIATDIPSVGEIVSLPDHSNCTCLGDGAKTVRNLPWQGSHVIKASQGTVPYNYDSNAEHIHFVVDVNMAGAPIRLRTVLDANDTAVAGALGLGGPSLAISVTVAQSMGFIFEMVTGTAYSHTFKYLSGVDAGYYATFSGVGRVLTKGFLIIYSNGAVVWDAI